VKRGLTIAAAILVIVLALAGFASFATNTGVLVWSGDYSLVDAYYGGNSPDTTATIEPVGRSCDYLAYNGVNTIVMIEASALTEFQQSGRDLDPALQHAEIVDRWYDTDCPTFGRIDR
jgi:hypothetical protein